MSAYNRLGIFFPLCPGNKWKCVFITCFWFLLKEKYLYISQVCGLNKIKEKQDLKVTGSYTVKNSKHKSILIKYSNDGKCRSNNNSNNMILYGRYGHGQLMINGVLWKTHNALQNHVIVLIFNYFNTHILSYKLLMYLFTWFYSRRRKT